MPTITSEGCYVYNRPVEITFSTRPVDPTAGDPMADLTSRCKAAAKLNLRGDKYSDADRDDCAAKVLSDVLTRDESAPVCPCGGPAEYRVVMTGPAARMLPPMALCIRHARTAPKARRILPREYVASEVAFGTLSGMASNYRRSIDRDRKRDRAKGQAEAIGFVPDVAHTVINGDSGRLRFQTADQSARHAREMLAALGCRPLRKGDLNAYVLAYVAARSSTLLALDVKSPAAHAGAEIGLTEQQVKDATRRAAKRIVPPGRKVPQSPSVDSKSGARVGRNPARIEWSETLHLPDTSRAIKSSKSRTESADLADSLNGTMGLRTVPPTVAPITETRIIGCAPNPDDTADWTHSPEQRSADHPGQTVRPRRIGRATALRLARATELRRKDRATRTDSDRNRSRLNAGLPVAHLNPAPQDAS